MEYKTYFLVTGALFAVISLLQLSRLLFSWEANIGGWDVPMWLSVIFVLVAGFLAYSGFRLGSRGLAPGQ